MRIIGLHFLKTLGAILIALILGPALLVKLLAEAPEAGAGLFILLLLVSPAAYFIRQASRKKHVRHPARRARERTRIAA